MRRDKSAHCSAGSVTGYVLGGALLLLLLLLPGPASAAQFGLDQSGFQALLSSPQAGAHPNFTTTLKLNEAQANEPVGSPKDVELELPAGLLGNPTATPQCTMEDVVNSACPSDAAIGIATVTAVFSGSAFPITSLIYNLTPYPNEPAAFGFASVFPVRLDTRVRSEGDYGVDVAVRNVTGAVRFTGMSTTFWGVPADNNGPGPNGEETSYGQKYGGPGSGVARPFLTNPVTCSGASGVMQGVADSWANPGAENAIGAPVPEDPRWSRVSMTIPEGGEGYGGCDKLSFGPSIAVSPSSLEAGEPTGYEVKVHAPQDEEPEGLATPDVKDVVVKLPLGTVISPSAADGLGACSESEIGLHAQVAPGCPAASKIGTVTIATPLLGQALQGSLYVATQERNPFGSLFAVYLTAEGAGVRIKLAGEVMADETTGQLTVTFRNNPQLPFSDLEVRLTGGARAPLANPQTCGTATTSALFTPSSTPITPDAQSTSGFPVVNCTAPRFAPAFTAGTTNNQAGGFSPFTLTLARKDGEQTLGSLNMTLPPGLAGILASIAQCGEAQANAGTCSAASQIGHVTVQAGVGSEPITLPQAGRSEDPVYLSGPYEGAPFGLAVVVHPEAGPFNLEENGHPVVVRAKIEVNPHTAQASVLSGAMPTILRGIPLDVRTIDVTIDRAGFMFDPTSCAAMSIAGAVASSEGASESVSSHFQAANCANLPFKPTFTVSTLGKTSKANGASLDVKLTSKGGPQPGGGEANVRSVKVDLPKQLPSRLTTLQKACTEAQFNANPAGCPAASDVGTATALTPIFSHPLTGPAYFVSHGGEAFPDLEIVLQGEGVRLILDGNTDIKKGITSSTFRTVPDAPISSFELKLPMGPYSILGANLPASARYSLCGQKLAMPTAFVGQNGAEIHTSTPISVTGCKPAIAVVRHSVKGTTATVVVSVPAAGRLLAAGRGVSTGRGKAGKAGNVRVKVTLTKAEQAFLRKHPSRKLRAKIDLRFTPRKGAELTTSVTVLIA